MFKFVTLFRIFILQAPFDVDYTGIAKAIGAPQDYSKVVENAASLKKDFDLTVPDEGRPSNVPMEDLENVNTHNKADSEMKDAVDAADDNDYVPVSCLNTFMRDWAIKVKVTKKYPVRQWNNARGSGTLLNVDLMDSGKHQIQATFFKDAATKFDAVLKDGRTYVMKGGSVKIANKRFTTIPNDHCLTFDANAEITEAVSGIEEIAGNVYNFCSFGKIKESISTENGNTFGADKLGATLPKMIDIIAVVIECQESGQIQLKSTGEMRSKRNITFGDCAGLSVGATVWGDLANETRIQPGTVMAVKGAKVSDYGGKSLNISSACTIEYDPKEQEETAELTAWFAKYKTSGQHMEALTVTGRDRENTQRSGNDLPLFTVADIHASLQSDEQF